MDRPGAARRCSPMLLPVRRVNGSGVAVERVKGNRERGGHLSRIQSCIVSPHHMYGYDPSSASMSRDDSGSFIAPHTPHTHHPLHTHMHFSPPSPLHRRTRSTVSKDLSTRGRLGHVGRVRAKGEWRNGEENGLMNNWLVVFADDWWHREVKNS